MSTMQEASPAAMGDGQGVAVRVSQRLSPARRVLAQRMLQSQQTIPHFYAAMDMDMTAVQAERLRGKARGEPAATLNDYCVAAAAKALCATPELNASLEGEVLTHYADINIGIVMAVGDKLLVPVVRGADLLGPSRIAALSADLALRAHQKKLQPSECEDATFSVSNLGMFGVRHFTAIIPPGQAAILAVGAVQPRPVAWEDGMAVRPMATMTLSVDHRIADGMAAARFLDTMRRVLEAAGEGGPHG